MALGDGGVNALESYIDARVVGNNTFKHGKSLSSAMTCARLLWDARRSLNKQPLGGPLTST